MLYFPQIVFSKFFFSSGGTWDVMVPGFYGPYGPDTAFNYHNHMGGKVSQTQPLPS
jgi:hypothetical protein